jgi:hypothetical protein
MPEPAERTETCGRDVYRNDRFRPEPGLVKRQHIFGIGA